MLSGAYVEEGYKEFDRNFFSPCMTACNWEFRHVECPHYLLSEKFPSGLTVRIYRISLKQLIGVYLMDVAHLVLSLFPFLLWFLGSLESSILLALNNGPGLYIHELIDLLSTLDFSFIVPSNYSFPIKKMS